MHELVPDAVLRSALLREMPRLPFAFLEQRIPSPIGWSRRRPPRQRGWSVEVITEAQHLHIAMAPEAVADMLLRLEP